MKALITRKIGMTSVINDDGEAVGVTLLSAEPNIITRIKNEESDGYSAVQLGFGEDKRPGKAKQGQFKDAGKSPKVVKEFRVAEIDPEMKVGHQQTAEVFEVGEKVDVSGISKGKGFAGTIKRHNFQRGRKTHGGRSYRRPGSIGSMYPQKIFKGKKMAGHMGHEQVTTKRVRVAMVDKDLNIIGIRGAVPGPRKGIVLIKETR